MKQKIGTIFLEEFKKANVWVLSVSPFTAGTTAIICYGEQVIIKPIVDKVTQHFIERYKQQN